MVRAATETAVIASISTPVFPVVFTVATMVIAYLPSGLGMEFGEIALVSKSGGKSGTYVRSQKAK